MTQEDLNEVMGKSLANYQLRQLAEDGDNLESVLTLIDRLESELLNAQEHVDNLEFLLKQKNEKISQLEAKAEAYDRLMSGGKKTLKEIANFLGNPVAVDREGRLLWSPKKPEIGLFTWIWYDKYLPKNIFDYTGDWKDSLTMPDGWEEHRE